MTVIALNLSDSLEEVAADGPWDGSLPEVEEGPLLGMAMIRSSYSNRGSCSKCENQRSSVGRMSRL